MASTSGTRGNVVEQLYSDVTDAVASAKSSVVVLEHSMPSWWMRECRLWWDDPRKSRATLRLGYHGVREAYRRVRIRNVPRRAAGERSSGAARRRAR